MICIVSIDFGAVTFLHWLQMAAVLLSVCLSVCRSVGLSVSDKGLLFSQPCLFSHAGLFGSEQLQRY